MSALPQICRGADGFFPTRDHRAAAMVLGFIFVCTLIAGAWFLLS